ncbi:MAG: hypothetical protein JW885_09955 [Deltaproteobacteria bacterium]|nr:hypothetical protein [Candidatus Zymogenaceae bacterium]
MTERDDRTDMMKLQNAAAAAGGLATPDGAAAAGKIISLEGCCYLGLGRFMIPIPPCLLRRGLKDGAGKGRKSLRFMTPKHHLVRDFVVTEIPRRGKSLSPDYIAGELAMSRNELDVIVDELEEHMVFLYRVDGENVTWAYPVTAEPTPHHMTFSTGEFIYAA